MATEGGPIFPHSAFPVTADVVYPNVHVGGGANSKHDEGMGVMASVDADGIWRLRFQMPATLPTGTLKLKLVGIANASTGNAKVNPKWNGVGEAEDPSAATLNTATGVQTIAFTAVDDYKTTYISLTGGTLAAKDELVMDLTFETSSWTLAAVSTWIASIVWE
jgi:hypothetical protein